MLSSLAACSNAGTENSTSEQLSTVSQTAESSIDEKPTESSESVESNTIDVSFDGDSFSIPASYVTDRSIITATVTGVNGTTTLDDWTVTEVKRPKGSKDCSEFLVTYKSETGDRYKYKDGETITIAVTPVEEATEEHVDFTYNVAVSKKVIGLGSTKFERATK